MKIQVTELANKVIELAYRHPNKTAACNYEFCIVGMAIKDLDRDFYDEIMWSEKLFTDIVVPNLYFEEDNHIDQCAIEFVAIVQGFQDNGNTWGKSVELATKLLAEFEIDQL